MPRTRTEEKRDAILRAAASVFSARDYHDVLTDEIAAAAGVGKGTLYRYFRTKDDLYFATLLKGYDELEELFGLPAPADEPAASRLGRIAGEVLRVFWSRRPFYMLLHRDAALLQTRNRELKRRREGLRRVVADTIRQGIARGEFRPVEPCAAASLFIGLIRGALVDRRPSDSAAAYARQIGDIFLDGISRKEAS